MPHAPGARAPEDPPGPVGTPSQSCGWPGACGSLCSYEKPAGPGQDWKPPLQTHSSSHSLLANRRGPINRPAEAARKKPSVLATGTAPARQPEPEAPALPAGHPAAGTPGRPGLTDSQGVTGPAGNRSKIGKQTPGAVKLVLLTTKTGRVCI